jgi:hypothetical protein
VTQVGAVCASLRLIWLLQNDDIEQRRGVARGAKQATEVRGQSEVDLTNEALHLVTHVIHNNDDVDVGCGIRLGGSGASVDIDRSEHDTQFADVGSQMLGDPVAE